MRYLIVDTDKLSDWDDGILSEEESLTKFKEIWDEASLSTKCATSYAEDIDQIYIDKDWEEFKNTL